MELIPTKVDIAVNDGWAALAAPIARMIEDRGGTVYQVKEKFGGLRIYYDPNPQEANYWWWAEMQKVVDSVERLMWQVCEDCGDRGWTLNKREDGGNAWQRTLCESCATRRGYKIDAD